MSCTDSHNSNGCVIAKPKRAEPVTVEEHLNERIESARKHVENLCIAKAKVETLGLLKYPHSELIDMLAIF